jgi:NAD(P)H dehydrogenase (quinone)
MRIAVTAANGGLGKAIVRELKGQISAENIVALARTPHKAALLGVEVRPGDYADASALQASLADVSTLLLVSAFDAPEKRIALHRNVISAAKSAGVRKIVYTSIIGDGPEMAFSPIVASNRQTEADIAASGLAFAIGRNSLYLEADLEYMETYRREGVIRNSAGDGLCTYTSRPELARAYSRLLLQDRYNDKVYHLAGPPVKQSDLAAAMNRHFNTRLRYEEITVDAYIEERKAALGEYLGTIIGGIYAGIRLGNFNVVSDFSAIVGREHYSLDAMIEEFKSAEANN